MIQKQKWGPGFRHWRQPPQQAALRPLRHDRDSPPSGARSAIVPSAQAAAPFFAAAVALILASLSLHRVVTLERVQREGSKKKEYDSVADEWVHQRVTESESDDESVEALTVRTPLQ